MKGGMVNGGSYVLPTKRRWKGLAFAVIALLLLSSLVPLFFLLRLHDGFYPSGYLTGKENVLMKDARIFVKSPDYESPQGSVNRDALKRAGVSKPRSNFLGSLTSLNKTRIVGMKQVNQYGRTPDDESRRSCEPKFGSYCLWRQEHSRKINDSMVKKLKDQLFVARAYYPSIAKVPSLDKLTHELKQNIQEFERILVESTADSDLPNEIRKISRKMEAVIAKARKIPVDCSNIDKKFRQLVDITEDEANFHMRQSAFLFQLASKTVPKSLHCLSMRLTLEYFRSLPDQMNIMLMEKYLDPSMQHYIIFSNNVVAASVVVNSTVSHLKESRNSVFHVLTDGKHYFAMKFWFTKNIFKNALVEILNVEDMNSNGLPLQLSLPKEFHISFYSMDYSPEMTFRTEYLSTFSHLHFFLPDIFDHLEKVVILGDDIVVQHDLSPLWNLDMGGKVNGVMSLCTMRLQILKTYLDHIRFNASACFWMSGLNILDLASWRKHNLTSMYLSFINELARDKKLAATSPLLASLLTFQDLVYVLDDSWVLSGLGHDYSFNLEAIEEAAVLHYSGNMKPWMEIGIPQYKPFWRQHLGQEAQSMSECNVNM